MNVTAILLAAGPGVRFWPYNGVRNKCAFPIANVPAIRRTVNSLAALGVEQLVVVTGPGEASVRHALHNAPITPHYVSQPTPAGTAAAALLGMQAAGGADAAQPFLIIHGDVVTAAENLARLLECFDQNNPLAAALIQPLGQEKPQDWLVAHVVGDLLRGVEGHPRGGAHRLAGAYVLDPRTLPYLQNNPGIMNRVPVGGMPPVESEIAQSVQMMLDEGAEILAVETPGYHVDLDKPWHILQANEQVIQAMSAALTESVIPATARIHDGAEISGRVVLGEHAQIGNRAVIRGDLWLGDHASVTNGAILDGPVVVGAHNRIRDYCQIGGQSTLGPRGVYGHGAEFSGVALETVYCYHYCEIWGVVGQAVDFGAATVCGNLRFDDSQTTWRIQGRRETPTHSANAAYLGDFCRTGVNAIIMPGRRMGVYSVVGAGVVLYDDLADRQLITVKQETITRPWGPEQYGW